LKDYLVRYRDKLLPKAEVMVCGLPDSGLVAKIGVDQLVEQLRPELVAEIFSPHLPPQVLIREDGVVEPMSHRLYYAAAEKILIYTGDSQPVDPRGAYSLSELVVDLATRSSVSELIILAAMIKGAPVEEPNVFVSATDDVLAGQYEALGAKKTTMGAITWMHGLILGKAIDKGVKAVCLSGETQGDLPDPVAAERALRVVEKRLNLKLDMRKLLQRRRGLQELAATFPPGQEAQPEAKKREPTYIG
jgi:uncharacterized protein